MAQKKQTQAVRGTGVREAAAQATRDSILKAATKVFARYGYDGGSIEKISSSAKTHDRMIYYYFGSKEGLFIAVLEGIYDRMDRAEATCAPDTADPVAALKTVIRFKIDYYRRHPEFVTLLNTENLHKGKHVAKSEKAVEYSSTAVDLIRDILDAGAAQGLFRADLHPRDAASARTTRSTLSVTKRSQAATASGVSSDSPRKADSVWRLEVKK